MLKFSFLLGFFALVVMLALPAGSSAQLLSPNLYSIVGEARAVSAEDRSSIASVREAEISFGSGGQLSARQDGLTVQLFDGKQFEARLTNGEERASDDLTWRGKIKNAAYDGDVVITFRKGFYSALIYGPDAVYEIVPRGDKHFLVQLDQSRFPECAGDLKGPVTSTQAVENLGIGVDSGDRIDVMVVYTTATKNFLGGDAQAQAHAQAAIDATNTAYINSKIRQRVRMVHTQEFVYTETTASADLSNLRNNVTIQGLRNTHNADLVAEISEVTGVCGIGYLMGQASGNQNNAFTVTVRSCAVGNLSFAHELGHNMGSQHNPENASTPTFTYSFGHYVNGNYRTVMSYSDPCTSGCTRRPYFSNPDVIFNGAPTGINNARDNARSINNTADVITAYRYSGSSITLTNYNGGDWLPRNVGRNITWTSDNITGNVRIEISRDESVTWETLIASTANDGTERVNVPGRATRRARVRVASVDSPIVSDSSVRNVSIR
jgi:hypothetical protein